MKTFAEQEAGLQKTKIELKGDVDAVRFELSRRLTVEDMKVNFKALCDMLFVKFSQLEDLKQGLRDMLVY